MLQCQIDGHTNNDAPNDPLGLSERVGQWEKRAFSPYLRTALS